MGRTYPALDVRVAGTRLGAELLYAALDDFSPFAIEERESGARVFFTTSSQRDRALSVLSSRYEMSPVDVADDDWALRSQQNLSPVTVGRVTILPNSESRTPDPESGPTDLVSRIVVAIPPSMGFGTGHHATTRLCLAALQAFDLTGKTVLDVGTGSGVLAIVATRLGARSARGIDIDADAVQSARDNLRLNPSPRPRWRPGDPGPEVEAVTFVVADLEAAPAPGADAGVSGAGAREWDVVIANLTGALLVRSAPILTAATRPGGVLIVGGLLREERDEVVRALTRALAGRLPAETLVEWERHEDNWVGLAVRAPDRTRSTDLPREIAAR